MRLRDKIEKDKNFPELLITIRGEGISLNHKKEQVNYVQITGTGYGRYPTEWTSKD